jgi:hypothetical protein
MPKSGGTMAPPAPQGTTGLLSNSTKTKNERVDYRDTAEMTLGFQIRVGK